MVALLKRISSPVSQVNHLSVSPSRDSLDKVKAWQNDPEYVQLRRDVGEKHAKFRSYAVETQ